MVSEVCDLFFGSVGSRSRAEWLRFVETCGIRMKINQASADPRRDRCALHWATVERRVATLRLRTCHVEDPFKLRIENRNVRMRTLFQRAAIGKSKDARGIGRTHLHDAFQIDEALVDEIKG